MIRLILSNRAVTTYFVNTTLENVANLDHPDYLLDLNDSCDNLVSA